MQNLPVENKIRKGDASEDETIWIAYVSAISHYSQFVGEGSDFDQTCISAQHIRKFPLTPGLLLFLLSSFTSCTYNALFHISDMKRGSM